MEFCMKFHAENRPKIDLDGEYRLEADIFDRNIQDNLYVGFTNP